MIGRDGQRYFHAPAVLALANGLIVLDALAALDARKICWLLVLALRRNEDGNRLADRLFGLVAEKLLRPVIPRCDDAVQVFADDGVVRKLDDGGQALRMALAKRLNRRAHALLQPLGQPAKDARPLGLAAFGFLPAVDFVVHAHRKCRVTPVPT